MLTPGLALAQNSPLHPLDPAERQELKDIRSDPAPPQTVRDLHYLVSNEYNQHQFYEDVKDIGGVWIGVGADQNYIMAAWARPEFLVFMDFDQVIVDLHLVYRAAFIHAESPRAFMALWRPKHRRAFRKIIMKTYAANPAQRRAATKAFYMARRPVLIRLQKITKILKRADVLFFLSDQKQYDFLRNLFIEGRTLAIRGDLTAQKTLRDLGAILSAHKRIVRVLYLSNAEQYFPYSAQFKKNIKGLPIDGKSLILRTRPTGRDYTYIIQTYQNFLRWLEHPKIHSVRNIVPRRKLHPSRPLYRVVNEPKKKKPTTPQKSRESGI
jgi:hypothetical protein